MTSSKENVGKALGESGEKSRVIRVLLIRDGVPKDVYSMAVQDDFKEISMVQLICGKPELFKEIMGYEMMDKSLLRVSAVRNPCHPSHHYIFEVKSPMLRTEVQVAPSNNDQYEYTIAIESPKSTSFEFDKFNKLLLNDRFSDLTLCVDGRLLPAHKAILANKSPVFDALFQHDTQRLELASIEYNTLVDLLCFIYKGYINDQDDQDLFIKYSKLLKADAKYFVSDLKKLCEQKLSLCIDIENVLDCLVLADSCNAARLKESAIAFFVQHRKRIVEMPSYDNFVILNSQILCKLLKDVALAQTNSA